MYDKVKSLSTLFECKIIFNHMPPTHRYHILHDNKLTL